ncbi:uncharacterized protein BHQ10_000141 [Talaromyces amestolkiae]|uniref:Uncharacterized protein n=1 Tax=Talaromyces amestolkiae TaxID=1196081 RepID=A0A364KKR0_TALAM|nr:uncharacterized protein BHQ10_000141 [Talaromyces amestolkiae]RAO64129.1 hypothetical protein BHQ10_000141 [Talaromyces amestolkiae]
MCIKNMAFLKPHLRRKSSERSRPESLGTSVRHRKSESSPSRTASVPDTEKKSEIDVEVEHLFQQATDTNRGHTSDQREDPKEDSSLLHKLMRRKDPNSKSTGLTVGIRRSFSQRVRPKWSNEPKPVDDTVTRGSSLDFASETGYDSDAAFITSPRFSEQSWDSRPHSSPFTLDRTMTSLNHVLADDMKIRPGFNDDNEAIVLPSTRHLPNVLSISKRRRGKTEHPVDRNGRCSRWVPSIHLSSEGERPKETPALTKSVPKKSRFMELLDHPGLQGKASIQQPRKVSIGWMSEGKRCGYGYSFVDKDENHASGATDGPGDNSLETEERKSVADDDDASNASFTTAVPADNLSETESGSGTDATLVDNGRGASLRQSTVEAFSELEDKDSIQVPEKVPEKNLSQSNAKDSSKPDFVSSSYRRQRWTLFPSYTRAERNKVTDPNDAVIVRDFCPKASPDRPQREDNDDEKKHDLVVKAIRQGFHDTFLWVIGLGKREIARYHAGFQVQAARSHENVDLIFEPTVPFWDHVPKEELGDYHIEAWRAAKRRPKKRSRNLRKFRVSVTHNFDAASKKRKRSMPSPPSSSLSQKFREDIRCELENGTKYVGRRHSAKF